MHIVFELCSLSRVQLLTTLFATPWTLARQTPLSKGILQARILEQVAMPSSSRCFQPGIKPRSPTLQVNSLPSGPPGKPKNTGVGSLFLLKGNLLTQEENWGLKHCRWVLYQLSYQGSSFNLVLYQMAKFTKAKSTITFVPT